jgi:hypothetical protein
MFGKKKYNLGRFDNIEDAITARKKLKMKYLVVFLGGTKITKNNKNILKKY